MMNRKNNPWISMVALLVLILIITMICTGCAVETNAKTYQTTERFTKEYAGNDCFIITDNQTGVQYLAYVEMSNYGRGIGLTKLEVAEDANDK